MDAFGIYIHWPYCAAKCPYCDFNSHVRRDVSEARYLAAVLREFDFYAELAPGRTVSSIFFGGGTPSLMHPATAAEILDAIAEHWPVAPDAEITLEANPSSVEAGRFADFRRAGVNRVSLGVQSLSDDQLRFLGRVHDAVEALAAIDIANAHFDRVSFDLIYARPGQTLAEWRAELSEALTLAAGHLSLYQLTIEPGTAFHRLHEAGKLDVPPDDDAARLYELTQELCDAAGLPAYEVSNHARPGEEARHNLLYWRYGDYAGIGPGAHGRIATAQGRLALSAERDPAKWAIQVEREGHGLATREALGKLEEAEEMLLMGLRLSEGVSPQALEQQTGFAIPQEVRQYLMLEGLLEGDGTDGRITVSPRGRLVLNSLIGHLAGNLCPADRLAARHSADLPPPPDRAAFIGREICEKIRSS
jgi:putative oxygen-independent coproporphyrinogen III oxidase